LVFLTQTNVVRRASPAPGVKACYRRPQTPSSYHRNPRYLQIKKQMTDGLIACADAAVPGLADAIEFQEASTPLTNFRYTRNPRGAIEGYENSPENTGLGWLPQQTPIHNLFLAGAWTNTGGQNPAIASGAAAARLAMQLLPARAHLNGRRLCTA
jgi:phytoene dehydrogenase-like protein